MKAETLAKVRSALFVALALVAVTGSAFVLPVLDGMRAGFKRSFAADVVMPPEVILANRAGGIFRAFAISTLWMRATDLQDRGEVFELVQLYKMITALEPRFPVVWAYRAWNAAYNVSVKFPIDRFRLFDPKAERNQPEERWRWVQRGIEALRDEGVPWNPKSEVLHKELAWIYSHKIGDSMDDAHLYYKVQLARLVEDTLGEPPYRDTLERLRAAPKTTTQLLADPAVRTLVETTLPEAGLRDPFRDPIAVLTRSDKIPEAARAALDGPANADAVARLDTFLRAKSLRETHKLKAELMLVLMDKYGPIDWRLPFAHAVYWTQKYVLESDEPPADAANSERIAFHSIAEFYRRGRLTFRYDPEHPERVVWDVSQDFAFVDKGVAFYDELRQRYGAQGVDRDPIREGFMNFLREVVVDLRLHNDVKRSKAYYKRLQSYGPEKGIPYDEFIYKRFVGRVKDATYEQVVNLVRSVLYQGLVYASLRDMNRHYGYEETARFIRKAYNDKKYRHTIPPLKELYAPAFLQALLRLRPWRIGVLEELYPDQVKKAREELQRLRRPRPRPARAPAPKPAV